MVTVHHLWDSEWRASCERGPIEPCGWQYIAKVKGSPKIRDLDDAESLARQAGREHARTAKHEVVVAPLGTGTVYDGRPR